MRAFISGTIIVIAFIASLPLHAVTRDGAFANAKPYRDLQWTMASKNAIDKCSSDTWTRTPLPLGGITGMAYNWGGYSSIAEFTNGVNSTGKAYAGNRCTSHDLNPYGYRPNTVGVDCSGFVSRLWEIGHKLSTVDVYNQTVPVRGGAGAMRTGDVFVLPGEHVAMLVDTTPSGPRIVEAAGGYWRVVDRVATWKEFNAYSIRRYDGLQDAGIAKLVLTSGPASVRVGAGMSVRVDLRETDGDPIRYDAIALAIVLDGTNTTIADVQQQFNVVFTKDQQRSLTFTGNAPSAVGKYRLVVRGRVGDRWTDMIVIPPAVNGVPLTVTAR